MDDWKLIGPADTPKQNSSSSDTPSTPRVTDQWRIVGPADVPAPAPSIVPETPSPPLPSSPPTGTPTETARIPAAGRGTGYDPGPAPKSWKEPEPEPELEHKSPVPGRGAQYAPMDIRNLLPTMSPAKVADDTYIKPVPFNKLRVGVGKSPEVPQNGAAVKVNLSEHRVTLFMDGTPVRNYSAAIGAKETPTPPGRFTVLEKTENKRPEDFNPGTAQLSEQLYGKKANPFGTRWLGFHIDASGDPAKEGYYGIHGTHDPSSIGKEVSHGCVRMQNKDVEELAKYVDVSTPVIVTKK